MLNELRTTNREVDVRSYFVKTKAFEQLEPIDILRHNVCHLVNLLAKLTLIADGPYLGVLVEGRVDTDAVMTEVIPDLVIYALQFAEALDVDIDRLMSKHLSRLLRAGAGEACLNWAVRAHAATDSGQRSPPFEMSMTKVDMLRLARHELLLATHEVARVSDSDDHNVTIPMNTISNLVIDRLLVWAFRLAQKYEVDLDDAYRRRLIATERKYCDSIKSVRTPDGPRRRPAKLSP